MSLPVILALAGFVALFAFAIWLGLRQSRELDQGLERKIRSEGWHASEDDAPIAQHGWTWFDSMRSTRDVRVERLVTNPGEGPGVAAFTLVTARYGGRAGADRHVGVGMVARLPRSISPSFIVVPVPSKGVGPFVGSFLGLALPAVPLSDPELAQRWSVYSSEPEPAADLLESDAALRGALMAVFESVWAESRFQILIAEFHGERAALLGGPKMVGRQPFDDLDVLAGILTERLR